MDFPSRPSSRAPTRGPAPEAVPEGEETADGFSDEAQGPLEAPGLADGSAPSRSDDPSQPERPLAASPRGKERRRRGIRSETLSRTLWALPWLIFAIAVTVLGGLVFAAAMIALAWGVLTELFRMIQRARPFEGVAFAAVAGMGLAAHFGEPFHILLVGVAFVPVLVGFALARESLTNVTWALAATVFAVVWVGLPFAHAVLLRDLPLHGAALLVDVLVATFFTDTFAYVGGRMFGQRPLAPMVSPNKTIEGLGIGILGGVLGFWLAGLYQDWLSGPEALLFGLCIALLAPLGDLFESMIKRDLDVKDTGRMLGPHGGLLDRLDAVMFTVVAGYYLALAIVY